MVHLPPRRVWTLLTDWAAAPAWMSGITEMHANGPTEAGMTIDFHSGGHERNATVTALLAERSITISHGEGDLRSDYLYELIPDGDGTLLTLTVDVVVAEALAEMAPEIRSEVARADADQLAAFRQFAESAP